MLQTAFDGSMMSLCRFYDRLKTAARGPYPLCDSVNCEYISVIFSYP